MKRSIPILLTLLILVAFAVCVLLVPVNASAQKEASSVTVKQDGDSIVLIPRETGKVFLVLGCPRAGRGQAPEKDPSGSLADHVGEQKIPVKEYSKVYLLEVRNITELDLQEPSGLKVVEKTMDAAAILTGKPCACDFPIPPDPGPLRAPAVNPANPVNPASPIDPEDPKFLGFSFSKPVKGAGA